jgi:hypothetical protein
MTPILSRRLVDLFADWISDESGRRVGVKFICPTCPAIEGAPTIAVLFANPVDGGPPAPAGCSLPGDNDGRRWQRTGDTIETITLSPSVDCSRCGHWHGFVSHGEAP